MAKNRATETGQGIARRLLARSARTHARMYGPSLTIGGLGLGGQISGDSVVIHRQRVGPLPRLARSPSLQDPTRIAAGSRSHAGPVEFRAHIPFPSSPGDDGGVRQRAPMSVTTAVVAVAHRARCSRCRGAAKPRVLEPPEGHQVGAWLRTARRDQPSER